MGLMSVIDHGIELSKKMLENVKKQVYLQLGKKVSVDLEIYRKNYSKEFKGNWHSVSIEDFIKNISESLIILGGDFHSFPQSQRTHLRILRRINKPVILALECFESKHQSLLNDFLSYKIEEDEFLKAVDWVNSWGFAWKDYHELLKLAQKRSWLVVGINKKDKGSDQSLFARDKFMAEQIRIYRKKFPDDLIYTVVGDLHISEESLFKELVNLGSGKNCIRIFQNSENLYFDLAEKKKENSVEIMFCADSINLGSDKYCVFTAPPWVKWQSYSTFLERSDEKEIQFQGEISFKDKIDYTDQVYQFVNFIGKNLKMNIKANNISVFTDLSFAENLEGLSDEEEDTIEKLLETQRNFYLPQSGRAYLGKRTVNYGASLAGEYIQSYLTGRKRTLWKMPEDYLGLIWIEAVSYFLSKFINNKRKIEKMKDLRIHLASFSLQDKGMGVLLLCTEQKFCESYFVKNGVLRERVIEVSKPITYVHSARILGPMLGEKLFLAFHIGKIEFEDLMSCLRKSVEDKDFENFYYNQVQFLESLGLDLEEEYRL